MHARLEFELQSAGNLCSNFKSFTILTGGNALVSDYNIYLHNIDSRRTAIPKRHLENSNYSHFKDGEYHKDSG
jgi:hypothetical protein